MSKQLWSIALAITLMMALAVPVIAQDEPGESIISFLLTLQNDDGGFSNGWAPESDPSTTADVVIAAIVLGAEPETFLVGDINTPISYLEQQVQSGAISGVGQLAKVLSAVSALGGDWADFAGHDLVADLVALQDNEGVFGYGAFDHCLAMIGLQNAGVDLPKNTVTALVVAQNEDGGWGFMAGEASDTNTTGLCVQSLAVADASDAAGAIEAGLMYFAQIQNDDGGWPYQNPSDYGTDSDSNSTALVVGALLAAGQELSEWGNPQDWLMTVYNGDGSYSYQPGFPGDMLSTVAVVPPAEGVTLNAWGLVVEAAD